MSFDNNPGQDGTPDFGSASMPVPAPARRGTSRATLFMVASLVLATFTAVLVFQVMRGLKQSMQESAAANQPVPMVASAREIPMGTALAEDDLQVVNALTGTIPEGEGFGTIDDLIGRTVRERVLAGEFIRNERLAQRDAGIGLNALINPGYRAMTIETTTQAGVGGFLQPGNFVDVIVTIRPDDGKSKSTWVTEIILQAVKVLAVGNSLDKEKSERERVRSGRSIVTLEVNIEQAKKLALSASKGELHLVMRSDVDVARTTSGGSMDTSLLIGAKPTSPPRTSTRAARPTTLIIEGGSREVDHSTKRKR